MDGLPWRLLSIWTSCKTKQTKVFPVDSELCFFKCFPFRHREVYSVNFFFGGGGAVEGNFNTRQLNAFNVRKIPFHGDTTPHEIAKVAEEFIFKKNR